MYVVDEVSTEAGAFIRGQVQGEPWGDFAPADVHQIGVGV